MDWHTYNVKPMSPVATSVTYCCITMLLIDTNACTPHIVHNIWVSNNAARLALCGPHGDLSVIHRWILTHQKVAVNTVYIWLTNSSMPILPPDLEAFKKLPTMIQWLFLDPYPQVIFWPCISRRTLRMTEFPTTPPSKTRPSAGLMISSSIATQSMIWWDLTTESWWLMECVLRSLRRNTTKWKGANTHPISCKG